MQRRPGRADGHIGRSNSTSSRRRSAITPRRAGRSSPSIGRCGPSERRQERLGRRSRRLLAGRKYTVFAGHVHRYQKFVRNGRTTTSWRPPAAAAGCAASLRRVRPDRLGDDEEGRPVLANILLDGVYAADMTRTAQRRGRRGGGQPQADRSRCAGKVYFEGTARCRNVVVFHLIEADGKQFQPGRRRPAEADGCFTLSTYRPTTVPRPATMWLRWCGGSRWWTPTGNPGRPAVPAEYARPETTPLRASVKAGTNEVVLELKK